jgi:hypothetical protein
MDASMSRSVNHAENRAYLEYKISQGKTRREAMRSLKRHLSRRLYRRLIEVPLDTIEASVSPILGATHRWRGSAP